MKNLKKILNIWTLIFVVGSIIYVHVKYVEQKQSIIENLAGYYIKNSEEPCDRWALFIRHNQEYIDDKLDSAVISAFRDILFIAFLSGILILPYIRRMQSRIRVLKEDNSTSCSRYISDILSKRK